MAWPRRGYLRDRLLAGQLVTENHGQTSAFFSPVGSFVLRWREIVQGGVNALGLVDIFDEMANTRIEGRTGSERLRSGYVQA